MQRSTPILGLDLNSGLASKEASEQVEGPCVGEPHRGEQKLAGNENEGLLRKTDLTPSRKVVLNWAGRSSGVARAHPTIIQIAGEREPTSKRWNRLHFVGGVALCTRRPTRRRLRHPSVEHVRRR